MESEGSENLELVLDNLEKLFQAYMPFIKRGGIFISTFYDYPMGSEINLSLTLLDEARVYKLRSKVVWVTPKGAQRGKRSGIGLQLINDVEGLNKKIETYLAGMLTSIDPTDTM